MLNFNRIFKIKNTFILIIFFIVTSFTFADKKEKIVVEGFKPDSSEIEYYDNGLIKSFSLNGISLKNTAIIITENSIISSIQWNIRGREYASKFDVSVDDFSIHFNSEFILPQKKKMENDIKIQGNLFSNDDFCLNITQDDFFYKRGNQYWIKLNNTVYDKNSYGQIDKNVVIRPLSRLFEKNQKILIGCYNCYEYNVGGFTYTRDESISLEKIFNREDIPKLYRFLNFYFMSSAFDVSTLPFLFLFDNSEAYIWKNSIVSYDASSFLKERNTSYHPENMRTLDGNPWASANGYGIGDSLFLIADVFTSFKIAIYNGFQSKKKCLYKQNSRAKKIEVINLDTLERKIYELQDTPEKQEILIQNKNDNNNLVGRYKIQILEVYPGSKYKDLCIQAIIAE